MLILRQAVMIYVSVSNLYFWAISAILNASYDKILPTEYLCIASISLIHSITWVWNYATFF